MTTLNRRALLTGSIAAGSALLLSACRNPFSDANDSSSSGSGRGPVVFGVSGPFTGDLAEYGITWKRAFTLALAEANKAGGIDGRKIELDYQDSQGDPKQAITIAQKFASDSSVIAELGDFASPSSMAASNVYQRAKLTQFGFTNSHPAFTKAGTYMWSTSPSAVDSAKALHNLAHSQGRRQAVLYLNSEWGKAVWGLYQPAAEAAGDPVAYSAGFLPTSTDYRPLLIKAKAAKPDVLVIIGYYKEAALLTQQARSSGFKDIPIVIADAAYSPQFIKLGGSAAEGVRLVTPFSPADPSDRVQAFVKKWQARYHEVPDGFAANAYDALNILIWAAREYGATRAGVHEGLLKGKNIPSDITGPFTFRADRRSGVVPNVQLVVRNGEFVVDQGAREGTN